MCMYFMCIIQYYTQYAKLHIFWQIDNKKKFFFIQFFVIYYTFSSFIAYLYRIEQLLDCHYNLSITSSLCSSVPKANKKNAAMNTAPNKELGGLIWSPEA